MDPAGPSGDRPAGRRVGPVATAGEGRGFFLPAGQAAGGGSTPGRPQRVGQALQVGAQAVLCMSPGQQQSARARGAHSVLLPSWLWRFGCIRSTDTYGPSPRVSHRAKRRGRSSHSRSGNVPEEPEACPGPGLASLEPTLKRNPFRKWGLPHAVCQPAAPAPARAWGSVGIERGGTSDPNRCQGRFSGRPVPPPRP